MAAATSDIFNLVQIPSDNEDKISESDVDDLRMLLDDDMCLRDEESSYLSSLLANTLKSNQVEINTDSKSLKPVARLKEPRDLFTLPKEPDCAQEAARWPAECQVVDMKIHHIEVMPYIPEVYYTSSGKEIVVKVIGEDAGQIVYQYNPMSAVNYFTRSVSGGNRVAPTVPTNGDLKFESRFESGNLAKAVKITETYYELSIRADLYTNKHMQWFYFMVENTKKGVLYRFSIVNLLKGDSLYNEGMRPVLYSCKDAVIRKIGWRRCGTNINYYQNDANGDDETNCTYTLTFNLEFPYDDDCVFLAHSYPYTYTDLQECLIKLQNHPVKSTFTKLRLLCKTLAGNNVYYLTVTDPTEDDTNTKPKKKAVVMTARVHPGESPASWMMKGVIDFITGDSTQAKELREKFIFKLIPMLNPDGVIVGNNRCSLSGRDLNRQYRTVIRETYPPVWHTKLMIKRLIEECGVAMYCDFHAHSRKHNVFIYGCENKRIAEKRLQEQVFPLMLHKNSADKFSFENCKFRINKDKEGTGRVVIWMMGVDNSYTLEASFSGSTLGSRHHTHFSTLDYEMMGKSFCETLLDYVDEAPGKDASPKPHKHHQPVIVYSPPVQRKAMQIPTAKLDLDGGEGLSSGDEHSFVKQTSPKRSEQKNAEPPPTPSKLEKPEMPPELIVTSTQGNDLSVFERLYKAAEVSRSNLALSKPVSRRGSYRKVSPERTRRKLVRQNGEHSDPECRSSDVKPIKQQFWRVLSNDNLPWSYRKNEHEHILKACSQKLAELKKKHKTKIKEKIEVDAVKAPLKKRVKRRPNIKIERTATFTSENPSVQDSMKVRPFRQMEFKRPEEDPSRKSIKKVPNRKFRKGGIVSLATVNSNNLDLSGDESVENNANKKKKKKRKLLQLPKSVKSAVNAVTAVTSVKKGGRTALKKT